MKRIAFYHREFRLCEWPEEPQYCSTYIGNEIGQCPSIMMYSEGYKRNSCTCLSKEDAFSHAVTSAMENGVRFEDQEVVFRYLWYEDDKNPKSTEDFQASEGDNWPAPEGAEIKEKCQHKGIHNSTCIYRKVAVLKSESVEKKETGAEKAIKAADRREQIMQLLEKYYDKVPFELVHALDRLNQSTPKE